MTWRGETVEARRSVTITSFDKQIDRGLEELRDLMPGFGFWGPTLLVIAVVLHFSLCEWRFSRSNGAELAGGEGKSKGRPSSHEGMTLANDSQLLFFIHARDVFLRKTEREVGETGYAWDKEWAVVAGLLIPLALAGVGMSMLVYSLCGILRRIWDR
jgi:hypothetical protein